MRRLRSDRLRHLCSELVGGLAGFGPVRGEDFGDLMVGHRREAGEHVLEVGVGIEAATALPRRRLS